ncbi:MAG TPA: PP2C family protein-serine/threonine phosphatase [Bryobacteraceae bacterium]|jgi:sigma-B regulation protein RsbU (phosphoserine phosphatase)
MSTILHTLDGRTNSKRNPFPILLKRVVNDLQRWLHCRWAAGMVPGPAEHAPEMNVVCVSGDAKADDVLKGEAPELICPIRGSGDGGVAALIAVGPRSDGTPYSDVDQRFADALCDHITDVLNNEQLARSISQELMDSENSDDTFDRLDHCHAKRIRGLEFGARCRRAGKSGADFFDVLTREDQDLMATIGSIGSAGLAGGVMLGGALASVRALAHRCEPLVEIAAELNRTLWEMSPEDSFTSFFCAQIDASRKCLRYVNAGHEAALVLRRRGGHVDRLEPTGAILGLSRKSAYRERIMLFEPGDLLAAFTDGVAESTGPSGVLQILRERQDCGVQEMAAHVVRANSAATDRTIVLVRSSDALEYPPQMEKAELAAA